MRLLLNRINACTLSVFADTLKSYNTVNLCEQCIVRAFAYIFTRVNMCASLLYKDVACENLLTVCTLNALSLIHI